MKMDFGSARIIAIGGTGLVESALAKRLIGEGAEAQVIDSLWCGGWRI